MSYFIKIEDPNAVRRRLLESSKDILHVLKGYYEILETREQKKEAIEELRITLSEAQMLVERIEKLLPEQSKKGVEEFLPKPAPKAKPVKAETPKPEPKEVKKAEPKAKPVKAAPPPKPKPLSDVEKLQLALQGIEQRLNQL